MTTITAGRPPIAMLVAAGVVLGIAYTLSPLTVLSLAGLAWVVWWAGQGLSPRARRYFYVTVSVAVALRLAAIAGLFLFADPAKPFDTFFGDEELFKSRGLWLRNIGLGIPLSPADVIYAFDDTGKSGYLFVLAYIQALVGDAPYGVHVFNASVYLIGALVMFRWVRPAFGTLAASAGVTVLFFLPSLFVWSISALKEPSYTLVAVGELLCAMQVARAPKWWLRVLAVVGVIALGWELGSLRKGGQIVAALGATTGLAAGLTITRPRLTLAACVLAPLLAAMVMTRPAVQDRLLGIARDSAWYHSGHVMTPGYSYKLLAPWLYYDIHAISSLPPAPAAAFVIKAAASYVVEPLPWKVETRTILGYLPEHMFWLLLMALVPFGFIAGLRRDALLTCLLAAHAFAVMMMVALTSGNVGTLIRHRGLALPYLIWLSALGACRLLAWATPAPRNIAGGSE